jgi:hypothetical protein
MNGDLKSPIFIGGLDNSGKTHLRLALSSHPEIAMTRRSYMWTRIYNRYGDLRQPENFERCLNALLSLCSRSFCSLSVGKNYSYAARSAQPLR